jgi:CelD/BcsL family acetyltransferase involved in cellulose biosynthesis
LKVELVSIIDTSRWAELLTRCAYASPFHHEGWAHVIATSMNNLDCFWLLAIDSDGTYLGGIPLIREQRYFFKRYLSMPFGTYGGLVLAQGEEALGGDLIRALARLLADSGAHSFFCALAPRSRPWPEDVKSTLEKTVVLEASTHVLELDGDFDAIWKGFQKRNRSVIRKAFEAGAVARVVSGIKPAETLHSLYRKQARGWRGHSSYPYRLVEACSTYSGRPFAQIWQALIDDEIHSSLLSLYDGHEVFPWLMGSTPESRRTGINNFLLSELIRDACSKRVDRVNLGGSMGDPGIEHFKRAFGAVKTPTVQYIWDSRFAALARRAVRLVRGR